MERRRSALDAAAVGLRAALLEAYERDHREGLRNVAACTRARGDSAAAEVLLRQAEDLPADLWEAAHSVAAGELAAALKLAEGTVRAELEDAAVLAVHHPRTLISLAEGAITYRHAVLIRDECSSLRLLVPARPRGKDPRARRAWEAVRDAVLAKAAALEAELLVLAPTVSVRTLRDNSRRLREQHHPETLAARHRKAARGSCTYLTPLHDGMARLSVAAPALVLQGAQDRLERIARNLAEDPEETRGLAELRAAAAIDLLLGGPAWENIAGHVHVLLPADVLTRAAGPDPANSGPANSDPDSAAGSTGAATGTGTPSGGTASTGTGRDASREGIRSGKQAGKRARVRRRRASEGCGHHGGPGRTAASPPAAGRPGAAGSSRTFRPHDPGGMAPPRRPGATDGPSGREPGAGFAELLGYGPIDPESARHIAASAPTWSRLFASPDGTAVVGIEHGRYRPTAEQRRALWVRDRTCRFPGCHRPAPSCEPDHVHEWHDGGATRLENLASLCKRHHTLKTVGLWGLAAEHDGALRFRAPSGMVHTTRPYLPWTTPGQRFASLLDAAAARPAAAAPPVRGWKECEDQPGGFLAGSAAASPAAEGVPDDDPPF